jgi:hypothetical protein
MVHVNSHHIHVIKNITITELTVANYMAYSVDEVSRQVLALQKYVHHRRS